VVFISGGAASAAPPTYIPLDLKIGPAAAPDQYPVTLTASDGPVSASATVRPDDLSGLMESIGISLGQRNSTSSYSSSEGNRKVA
jgi:hypothetical protein